MAVQATTGSPILSPFTLVIPTRQSRKSQPSTMTFPLYGVLNTTALDEQAMYQIKEAVIVMILDTSSPALFSRFSQDAKIFSLFPSIGSSLTAWITSDLRGPGGPEHAFYHRGSPLVSSDSCRVRQLFARVAKEMQTPAMAQVF